MSRAGSGSGALIGLLLTAALASTQYAGWRLLGLPFTPFALFDWIVRLAPGSVLTAGIEAMVGAIRGLGLGPTSTVAKAVEQALAIGLFLVAGAFTGALFFRPRSFGSPRIPLVAGAVLGTILGLAAAGIAARLHHGDVAPLPAWTWSVTSFAGWGVILGWSRRRLCAGGRRRATEAPAQVAKDEHPARAAKEEQAKGAAAPAARSSITSTELEVERIDRRHFLVRVGAATAAITLTGAVVGSLADRRRPGGGGVAWSSEHALPNADSSFTPAPGTRPELTPVGEHYRTDITSVPPRVEAADWRLHVEGLVDRPLDLTLGEIRDGYPPRHQFVTLACISNPVGGDLIGTTRWTGASLQDVLPGLGLRSEATHLRMESLDGFFEIVPLEIIRRDPRVMLAYAWDGLPLTQVHGFPLRVYIPDLYGMKQPKWIETIEAIEGWQAGYWVERGWDRTARMKATSVVDTVSMLPEQQERRDIAIGGIAHAGARGISRVEVQVDHGSWQPARLRKSLSMTTWVFWRFDWPFEPGRHEITVRCFDGQGAAQIVEPSAPHPSGATGLHQVERTL